MTNTWTTERPHGLVGEDTFNIDADFAGGCDPTPPATAGNPFTVIAVLTTETFTTAGTTVDCSTTPFTGTGDDTLAVIGNADDGDALWTTDAAHMLSEEDTFRYTATPPLRAI